MNREQMRQLRADLESEHIAVLYVEKTGPKRFKGMRRLRTDESVDVDEKSGCILIDGSPLEISGFGAIELNSDGTIVIGWVRGDESWTRWEP